jgi:hypothetical protein
MKTTKPSNSKVLSVAASITLVVGKEPNEFNGESIFWNSRTIEFDTGHEIISNYLDSGISWQQFYTLRGIAAHHSIEYVSSMQDKATLQ